MNDPAQEPHVPIPTPTTALWRKILWTLLATAVLALALSKVLDDRGFAYTEKGFKRAMLTFALARGLNGVLSVAQGTELAVAPAGVGVTFTPGQILDPLNDLVEWFSWVMLAAATSLGLQQLLLQLISSAAATWGIAVSAALFVGVLWWPRPCPAFLCSFSRNLLLSLALIRFAVPTMAFASEALYTGFLQQRVERATSHIGRTTEDFSRLNRSTSDTAQATPDASLAGSVKRLYNSTVQALDPRAVIDRFQQAAADVSEQVVGLIIVFLAQTVLLPLCFLWTLLRVLRRIVRL